MKLFGSAVALALTATSVSAAGLGPFNPERPRQAPDRGPWNGAYVGGTLGYGVMGATTNAEDLANEFGENIDADIDASLTADGLSYGLHAGYNFQSGSTVYGIELGVLSSTAELEIEGQGLELDYAARAMGKLGYASGDLLVYGTGGYAIAQVSTNGSMLAEEEYNEGGYVLGFGADYLVSDNVVIGAQYTYHRFNDFEDLEELDGKLENYGLRISYKF